MTINKKRAEKYAQLNYSYSGGNAVCKKCSHIFNSASYQSLEDHSIACNGTKRRKKTTKDKEKTVDIKHLLSPENGDSKNAAIIEIEFEDLPRQQQTLKDIYRTKEDESLLNLLEQDKEECAKDDNEQTDDYLEERLSDYELDNKTELEKLANRSLSYVGKSRSSLPELPVRTPIKRSATQTEPLSTGNKRSKRDPLNSSKSGKSRLQLRRNSTSGESDSSVDCAKVKKHKQDDSKLDVNVTMVKKCPQLVTKIVPLELERPSEAKVESDEETLKRTIAKFFMECNIPLGAVQQESFVNLVRLLRPSYVSKLPKSKDLLQTILKL